MWWKVVLFIVVVAVGLWVKCKVMDNLVAQPPELDEEEET